jgi:hypothetical protein
MLSGGPAVSLKGSPTVSPVTATLWVGILPPMDAVLVLASSPASVPPILSSNPAAIGSHGVGRSMVGDSFGSFVVR